MPHERENRGSIVQRLKRLSPFRKKVVEYPSVIPALEPREATVVAVKEEQPPTLTPFQQLERFLERESGISDPNEINRQVKLEKWLMLPLNSRYANEADPAYITIRQHATYIHGEGSRWEPVLDVSIHILPAYKSVEENRKMGNYSFHPKSIMGSLLLSSQEPALRIPGNDVNYRDWSGALWNILHFSDPNEVPRKWFGEAPHSRQWTTNDPSQLRSAVDFITRGDAFNSANSVPKVISKGY